MTVLVLGGAGYIGSVATERLLESGSEVVVYDNLSRGHAEAIEPGVPFVEGDLADAALLEKTIVEHKIDSVMDFCAFIEVGESVEKPLMYYQNNVAAGLTLLEVLVKCGVEKLVFSSTAALYGEPEAELVTEEAPLAPTSPYGRGKLMFEQILQDCAAAHGLRSVSLRYFNACGATEQHGEDHRPESHLIPRMIDVALGKREALGVYGRNYPTEDGTCVRDYVHVADLADAHLRALEALERGIHTTAYNLGNGHGFSVLEVIRAVEEVTCRHIPILDQPPRPGDPARLVASSDKIREELRWRPQISDLRQIIESALKWKQAHPEGYGGREG